MSAALDCQSLSHYSEFETASESGFSELSLVHPYQPRKFTKRSKSAPDPSRRVVTRGARATRRYENEAFLNTLSVITEADGEDLAQLAWPDSISHCSVFAKLFEDDSLRAVWDLFVSLSEKEQEQLLRSLQRSTKNESLGESDSDQSLLDDENTGSGTHRQGKQRSAAGQHNKRRPKRGHHKKSKNHAAITSASPPDSDTHVLSSVNDNEKGNEHTESQAELRGSIPSRFLSLISGSTSHPRRRGRKSKHSITPLDFCLIDRVEVELRKWFASTLPECDSFDTWMNQKRWTPTVSLLGEVDLQQWMLENQSFPDLIHLDAFGRLLVHSVASYLGLRSSSNWSEALGDRQLWVEKRFGRPFSPPDRTLVNLLKAYFAST